ncbi:MAG TPA: hypothetical protein VIK53_10635 [Verrucomicrobiae bacterium]
MKIMGVALFATALFCGCSKQAQSSRDQLIFKSRELLLEECTNETVGLTRIISANIYELPDEHPTNWVIYDSTTNGNSILRTLLAQSGKADATVEYVNSVGGIGRKEIPFVFVWWGDKFEDPSNTNNLSFTNFTLSCMPDAEKISDERMRKYQEEMVAIGGK